MEKIERRFQSLQVLRFIAAAGVIYYHAAWVVGFGATGRFGATGPAHLTVLGAAGVDLFFVISGAIIYLTAFERQASAWAFLQRRFIRVAPLYYITSLAMVVGLAASGQQMDLARMAATVTFWPTWGGGLVAPVMETGWTLYFEMLFYVGAALTLLSRRWLAMLALTFVTMMVLRFTTPWVPARFLSNPLILEFVAGALLMRHRARLRLSSTFALGAIGIGCALLLVLPTPDVIADGYATLTKFSGAFRLLLFGVPAVLVAWGAINLETFVGPKLTPLVYLGDASYSIYLAHWPIFALATVVFERLDWSPAAIVPASVAVGVGGGVIFYEGIEKPLTRFTRGRREQPACA